MININKNTCNIIITFGTILYHPHIKAGDKGNTSGKGTINNVPVHYNRV